MDGLPLTGTSASQHPSLKASHPAGTTGMSYNYILDIIAALISNKRIMFTIHDLVVGIAEPLVSLGVNDFQELIDPSNNHFLITQNMLKEKLRNTWREEHVHALTCLHTLLNIPPSQEITPEIARFDFTASKGCTLR